MRSEGVVERNVTLNSNNLNDDTTFDKPSHNLSFTERKISN